MRKVISLLAAGVLLLGVTATPVVAHDPVQADPNYNADCDTETEFSGENSRGWTTHRGSNSSGSYQVNSRLIGVRADINNVQPLWPCYDGTIGSSTSKSFVLISIQGNGSDGDYNFVQAGLAKWHYSTNPDISPWCADDEGMGNDQTYFAYTPNYSTKANPWNGRLCRATFVDFNNNGVPDVPVAGEDYEVSIYEYDTTSSNYWRVCFKRLSDSAIDCKNTRRTSADGGLASPVAVWWGFEGANRATALGVPGPNSHIVMDQPRYRKASDPGNWYYTEGSTPAASWGTNPSYWDWASSQSGTGEYWYAFTSAH